MDKKLAHVVETMILPFIKDRFPKWEEFIKGYYQYLDQSFFDKIINIEKNNNPFEIYSELVDDYLNNYFKDVINIEKYGLTDQNKRLYISLSKFIAGMRGNQNGFNFLFKSLTDFRFPSESGDIDIDKISVKYREDESWWSTGQPYTYRFVLDQSYEVMKELIESIHPAGFIFEFVTGIFFEEEQSIEDLISMKVLYVPNYDGEMLYDGTIMYGGTQDSPKYDEVSIYDGTILYGGTPQEIFTF